MRGRYSEEHMRGKYSRDRRRVFTSSGYKAAIGAVLCVAAALVLLLLVFLPATEKMPDGEKTIVSISNVSDDIGVGDNPSERELIVTYSDGTEKRVLLSDAEYQSLDLNKAGKQNVVLSYGGFEQTLTFNVHNVDCVVNYASSVGGKIEGESKQSVKNGENTETVIAVPERGYVFKGWEDGYPYPERQDVNVTETGLTHTAIFEKALFTVRFYYDDGTPAREEKVQYGCSPAAVPNPETDPKMKKYGYTFEKWVPEDFGSVTRDLVIRPEYKKTATDVIMTIPTDHLGNPMGSTNLREEGYYSQNENAKIVADPETAREFRYWEIYDVDKKEYVRVPKNGSAQIVVAGDGRGLNFESTPADNNPEKYQLCFTPGENVAQVKIKAIFAYKDIKVSFKNYKNDNPDNLERTAYCTIEGRLSADDLAEPEAVVIGMTFKGWYRSDDPEQKTVDGSAEFTTPATLIAKWETNTYELHFVEAGGGSVVRRVKYGATIASGGGLPAVAPTKENCIFDGWEDRITGSKIGNETVLQADERHAANEDFRKGKLYYIPRWIRRTQKVIVNILGEGDAYLNGVVVLGQETVETGKPYELTLKPKEGHILKGYLWYSGEKVIENHAASDVEINEIKVNLTPYSGVDNEFVIEFIPKKIGVKIENGDADLGGEIICGGETYGSREVNIDADFGSVVSLEIKALGSNHIKRVEIAGESVVDLGTEDVRYTLVLGRCEGLIEVKITYGKREYTVEYDDPPSGDGTVKLAESLSAPEREVSRKEKYAYGEEICFRIEAKSGDSFRKYIRFVKINNRTIDLFRSDVVAFGNRFINGKDFGVHVESSEGRDYYDYGTAELEIDGATALYGYRESIDPDAAEREIFLKDGETCRLSPENEERVKTALNVDAKSAFGNGVKDNRVTSLDMRLRVDTNYVVSFGFEDIYYNVKSIPTEGGTVNISSDRTDYLGNSDITAVPDEGYRVKSYVVNGTEYVVTSDPGNIYDLKLTEIDEDKIVRFNFERIRHKVNFIGSVSGVIKINNSDMAAILNNSRTVEVVAHSVLKTEISVSTNWIIEEITKNGIVIFSNAGSEKYTAREYSLVLPDISCDVDIRISPAPFSPPALPDEHYVLLWEKSEGCSISALYEKCGIDTANKVKVLPDYGYEIKEVKIGGESAELSSSGEYDIPVGTYSRGEEVKISVVTARKTYEVEYSVVGEGANRGGTVNNVATGSIEHVPYGEFRSFIVLADEDHYVECFRIKGHRVPFTDAGWSGLKKDGEINEITEGAYTFAVCEDVNIEVTFAKKFYRITLDPASVNGCTSWSSDGGGTDLIERGKELTVNMKADDGYHIDGIYVNGVLKRDYNSLCGDDLINEKKIDLYAVGRVNGNIVVKVLYERNRYSFRYEFINVSDNFGDYSGEIGRISCRYKLSKENSRYEGIPHGDNFCISVVPESASGYYLSKIEIIYRPAGTDENIEKSRLFEETDEGASGTNVWFNDFMELQRGEGITANVEAVKLFFGKRRYKVNATQTSEAASGKVKIFYTRGSESAGAAIVSGRKKTDGAPLPLEKYEFGRDGKIYHFDGTEKTETNITLQYSNGVYVYRSSDNDEYEFFIEHGLRYSIMTTPEEGYDRALFTINNRDYGGQVANNSYGSNLVGDLDIKTRFEIKTYRLKCEIVVMNPGVTGTVEWTEYGNFMKVTILVKHADGTETVYSSDSVSIPEIKGTMTYSVNHFDRIEVTAEPKFEEKGYYLYEFLYNGGEIPAPAGGNSPLSYPENGDVEVENDLSFRCEFRKRSYDIKDADIAIAYEGEMKPENEGGGPLYSDPRNEIKEESRRSIFWGGDANIGAKIGEGYEIVSIVVTRGDNPSPAALGEESGNEYFLYDKLNPKTGKKRDVLVIKAVKTPVKIKVTLRRKPFEIKYILNDPVDLETRLNEENNFPRITDHIDDDVGVGGRWTYSEEVGYTAETSIRYYDEIKVVIRPRNGYKLAEAAAVLIELDDEGNPVVSHEFPIEKDGDGGYYYFTFKEKNYSVKCGLSAAFNIKIKEYDASVELSLADAGGRKNNTSVDVKVRDRENGDIINIDGDEQRAILNNPAATANFTAWHHGVIDVEFTAAEGFMPTSLAVNGKTYKDFRREEFSDATDDDGVMKFVAEKNGNAYKYRITLMIEDSLINGKEKIAVELKIEPINYSVKTFIRYTADGQYEETSDDGKTLKVDTVQSVKHYGKLKATPEPYEGYAISELTIKVGNGTDFSDTGFGVGIADGTTVVNNETALGDAVDILAKKDVLYLYYTADIAKYAVSVLADVHSYDPLLALGAGAAKEVSFADFTASESVYSSVGRMEIEVLTAPSYTAPANEAYIKAGPYSAAPDDFPNGYYTRAGAGTDTDPYVYAPATTPDTWNNTAVYYTKAYDYFSFVKITASANEGYKLCSIEEYVDDNWQEVVKDRRGLNYADSADGGKKINYYIGRDKDGKRGEAVAGDRKFRVVFKQKTTVAVNVLNPYKYDEATGASKSYVELTAYVNPSTNYEGEEIENNLRGSDFVCDKYEYSVLVGDRLFLKYVDKRPVPKQNAHNFYTLAPDGCGYDYAKIDEQIKNKSTGWEITSELDLYLINNVEARVFFSETVFSAGDNRTAGKILFDGKTPRENYYGGKKTALTDSAANPANPSKNTVRVTVKPEIYTNEKGAVRLLYAFANLYVRQKDDAQSRAQGKIVYKKSSEEWIKYTDDRHGFAIRRVDGDNPGEIVFDIDMAGDIELKFEFYRIYDFTVATHFTDGDIVYNDPRILGGDELPFDFESDVERNAYAKSYTEREQIGVTEPVSGTVYYKYYAEATEIGRFDAEPYGFPTGYYTDQACSVPAAAFSEGATYYVKGYVPVCRYASGAAPEGFPTGYYTLGADGVYTPIGKKYVQYNAEIKLTAPEPPDNYQFVGWYINGVNTFGFLNSALPGAGSRRLDLPVKKSLARLIGESGAEDRRLDFIAVYQPIIKVAVINELFYCSESHWNSWEPGDITLGYFGFAPGEPIRLLPLYPRTPLTGSEKTVSEIKESGETGIPADDNGWKLASLPLDDDRYDDKRVFSGITSFEVLYQSFLDGADYKKNTWQNGYIDLNFTPNTNSVKLLNWQYYNWGTKEYQNIGYKYTASGYEYKDSDRTYKLGLGYLFGGEMPYAVSGDDETNHKNDRPLIIRPKLLQTVGIELKQFAYTKSLGGTDGLDDLTDVFHPGIELLSESIYNNEGVYRATYDYGARIKLRYDTNPAEDDEFEVERYRFIGWQANWKRGDEESYRMLPGQDYYNPARETEVDLRFGFNENPPLFDNAPALLFRAVYVKQYKQWFSSYNVAESEKSYLDAAVGKSAVKFAPGIEVNPSDFPKGYYTYNNGAEYAPVPETETVPAEDKIYFVENFSGGKIRISTEFPVYDISSGPSGSIETAYITSVCERRKNDDAQTVFRHEYFADVGLPLTVTLDKTEKDGGFSPADDEEYRVYKKEYDGDDPVLSYYDDPDCDDDGILAYASESVGRGLNALTYTVGAGEGCRSLDIQYHSKVSLTFTDLMKKAGIVVPNALRNYFTDAPENNGLGLRLLSRTIWDENAVLGDEEINGEVAMSFYLRNVGSLDFTAGGFYYALNGFKDGKGIPVNGDVGNGNLFKPSGSGFERHIEFSLANNISGTADNSPSVFGSGDSVGDGTQDAPYMIYGVEQFKNLNACFEYNGYGLTGDIPQGEETAPKIHFKLAEDIYLGNAWAPVAYRKVGDEEYGFDGFLDGNDKKITGGIATDDNKRKNEGVPVPAVTISEGLNGYGIFGCINGGTIKNLQLNFKEIVLSANSVSGESGNIGILTAKTKDAEFEGIKFFGNILLQGVGAEGVGLLAGKAENCTVEDVTIKADDGITIHGTRNSGGLIGTATDGTYDGICIDGITNACLKISAEKQTEALNSGGIFGKFTSTYLWSDTKRPHAKAATLKITGGVKVFVGNNLAVNVGGVAGRVKRGEISNVIIENASEGGAIRLIAKGDALTAEKTYSLSAADTDYGKAGGVVGLNDGGYIHNDPYANTEEGKGKISGAATFFVEDAGTVYSAGTAGGVAGASIGETALIQGFTLDAEVVTLSLKMGNLSVTHNIGGIVGGNGKEAIIDDCGIVASGGHGALMEITDGKEEKGGFIPGTLTLGGIAALNCGRIYNSFAKGATLKVTGYKNGFAPPMPKSGDNKRWKIISGGIIGTMYVARTGNEDFGGHLSGLEEALSGSWDAEKIKTHVQSCFTNGVKFAVTGSEIDCDPTGIDTSSAGSDAKAKSNYCPIVFGGIIGMTEGVKYREYTVSNCYSVSAAVTVNGFRASGKAEKKNNEMGDTDCGWCKVKGDVGPGVNGDYRPNRIGVNLLVNVYGIVSVSLYGNDLIDAESGREISTGACDYCWSKSGDAAVSAPQDVTCNETVGHPKDTTTARNVYVLYTGERLNGFSTVSPCDPLLSGIGETVWTTGRSVEFTIDNNDYNLETAKTMFYGGFVGTFDGTTGTGTDGRIYKTDITTGLPVIAHNLITDGSAPSWYKIENGEPVIQKTSDNAYMPYNGSSCASAEYMVREQGGNPIT